MARIDGTGGNDTLIGTNDRDDIDGRAGDDILRGRGGNDDLDGDGGSDILWGGAGRDGLDGDSGNDHLLGGRGNDELEGDDGNDVLHGGGGRDRLDGGDGHDVLIGGRGPDVFEFERGDGNDRIADFDDGSDVIRLDDFSRAQVEAVIAGAQQDGDDVVLTLSANTFVRLEDMNLAQLDLSDFSF